MSLEVLTVLVAGPMAIFLVWAILNNSKWRHPLQIIICTMELYGGWMTFGPGTEPCSGSFSLERATLNTLSKIWRATDPFSSSCFLVSSRMDHW